MLGKTLRVSCRVAPRSTDGPLQTRDVSIDPPHDLALLLDERQSTKYKLLYKLQVLTSQGQGELGGPSPTWVCSWSVGEGAWQAESTSP